MGLLLLASAGCRLAVSLVDGVASLLSLFLRLNGALAARLVSLLSAVADGLLLLLDCLTTALRILLTDLAAFVADIGNAVLAVTDLGTSAVTEAHLVVSRVLAAVLDGVGSMATAVARLYWSVASAVTTAWSATTGVVLTGVRSLELMYWTTVYALTMIPDSIVYCIVRCFTLVEDLLKGVLFGFVSGCGAAADGVRRLVFGVVDGVRSVPPSAVLGAALLLLAALGVRRLVRVVTTGGLPVEQLQAAAARLRTLCRRLSASIGTVVWHHVRPPAAQMLRLVNDSVRTALEGARAAVAACRLSVAVALAAVDILTRCVRAFVENVALGLRLRFARPAPLLEPEPQERRERQGAWELQDRQVEEGTPPPALPAAAPRRRLRGKTAAGRSVSGEASRVCVVCLDEDKSVILLPCRHVCVCEPCGRAVGAGDRRCPICRGYIEDALRVFL